MIRIIIADDHAIVRGGLKQIIATTTDIVVVGEATKGQEVLDRLSELQVDLVLLDMAMPDTQGVDLIQSISARWPSLPILVLSMHNEGQIVARALKAGARGYVTKDSEPEVLISGIRKITDGGKFMDPALVDVMLFDVTCGLAQPRQALSGRELQVLEGISAGQSLGQIAEGLHLSPKTVSTHKMRLMEKLSIDNNADLMRYAIRHGLAAG
ncbi:MAG: response regulator transcription factor [Pseudomonadota bacterium]